MEYISTRNTQKTFSFSEVFLKGLAPDGGLFVPKNIPLYSSDELKKLRNSLNKESGKMNHTCIRNVKEIFFSSNYFTFPIRPTPNF